MNDHELEDFRDELRTNLQDIYDDLRVDIERADRHGWDSEPIRDMRKVKEKLELTFQELDFLATLPTDQDGNLHAHDLALIEAFEVFEDVNRERD